MSRNPLVIDAVIAVVIVALVLIIEPGVAIAAILALVLLVGCGISYLIARRPHGGGRSRRRGRPASPARPRPRRR